MFVQRQFQCFEPRMLETELTSSLECNNTVRFESVFPWCVSKANSAVHNHFSDCFQNVFIYVFVLLYLVFVSGMVFWHLVCLSDSWCFMVLTEIQVSGVFWVWLTRWCEPIHPFHEPEQMICPVDHPIQQAAILWCNSRRCSSIDTQNKWQKISTNQLCFIICFIF